MTPISAVIITRNEAENISRCIESVQKVADEVIVVDAYSEDDTVEICKKLGARIFQKRWEGYSNSKNFGNDKAEHDFILSLDADEVLSDKLVESISIAKRNLTGVYRFNRLTNYCGKWIYYSGWYPDRKVRLFDRRIALW